jgi:two-component system, cell cycle response regulator
MFQARACEVDMKTEMFKTINGQRDAGDAIGSRDGLYLLLKILSERNPGVLDDLNRVARLAVATAEELGLDAGDVERVELAARLHDVGMIAIPDAIMNKPGGLIDAEWTVMRTHPEVGQRILAAAPSLAPAARLVRFHHERYDGRGYPDGLKGKDIPIGARIIAVCAAFVAMMRSRPFSDAITVEEALAEIDSCSGSQFDPHVAEVFCGLVRVASG